MYFNNHDFQPINNLQNKFFMQLKHDFQSLTIYKILQSYSLKLPKSKSKIKPLKKLNFCQGHHKQTEMVT